MSFLAPLMLAFGILIPVLILLYLLKVRRREYEISSTYLWQNLLRDLAAHEPWQRLHWSILLIAQLAIVALVVFTLARPFLVVQAQERVHAVLVLDASASMQATDVEPNRFEVARRAARQTIRDLGEGSVATIILAKAQPEVLAPTTGDRQLLNRALDVAEVSFGKADMQQVLALAGSLGPGQGVGSNQTDRARPRVYLFTDGAFGDIPPADGESLDVRLVTVGESSNNQGITALAARPDPQNARRFQLFARVHNYADSAARNALSVEVDGALAESRQIELSPGTTEELVFSDLPLGARAVQAQLSGTDHFPLDNSAYAALDIRRTSEILLVSQGNVFLEKVLSLLPNSEIFRVVPRRYFSIDADRYDVVIFDGFVPDSMPRGSALFISPPESSLFVLEGELRRPRIRRWERDDPVLQFVDLRDVAIARAQRMVPPSWSRTLIESDDGPLLLAGEHEGRRTVVVPFDIRQSNLPLSAAFPILMANILGYLEPGGQSAMRELHPGDSVTLVPLPHAEELEIRRPSGLLRTIRTEGRPITFTETWEPGLYSVSQRAAGQPLLEDLFAINVTDQQESDIRPRTLSLGDGRAMANRPDSAPANREIWLWLIPPVLGLMLFEWYWFHRRS